MTAGLFCLWHDTRDQHVGYEIAAADTIVDHLSGPLTFHLQAGFA